MALGALKWVAEVAIADNSGKTVPRFYEAPDAAFADFAAFQLAFGTLLTQLNLMTSGVVAAYRLTQVFVESTLVLPASGVENENQAFFSGKIVGDPTDSATQSIPAADPSIFVATSGPGANVVNVGVNPTLTWIALFDATGPWTVSDGEAWDGATVQGKRRHTKNSNG